MKKTQNRKMKAILSDYETLSKTLSKKSEIMETLSEKYNISTKTISRMLKKDNTFEKSDNVSIKSDNVSIKSDNNILFGSITETLAPSEDDYDYDDEANDLLEEYFKTHDRDDVSGIYFDENGKLKIKKYL